MYKEVIIRILTRILHLDNELDTLAQDYEEEKTTKNFCFSSKNDKDNIKILIK